MQPTFSSSRILLPARPWFVHLTVLLAFLLNCLPTGNWPGVPDWVALVLCFWGVRESRLVGMGWGFVLGLAMDVADGSLMGQHALAYVLVAYAAAALSRRVLWFPLLTQALHVLPILVGAEVLQLAIRAWAGAEPPSLYFLATPLVATVLWVPVTYLLLLPQYQPVERDANRPI